MDSAPYVEHTECSRCFGVGLWDDGKTGEVLCVKCLGHGALRCSPTCQYCAGNATVIGLSWGEMDEVPCVNVRPSTREAVNAWHNAYVAGRKAAMRNATPDVESEAA